ncbi:DUF445 domain-containing protein [Arachidicoccus sp.]|uniref:DUF445 domain-containing protein n=1 Tax=Arachidicoccus sp. TaxID=1872624 RepID=UPI003D1A2454
MKTNNTSHKKAVQLKKHKTLATSFFIIMLALYIITEIVLRSHTNVWLGYVKAFAEAAMVGALADWFAVTALFHHPAGLKIPHTNLIEKKKQDIGNNLGAFVVDNFLNPETIRPYIDQIDISGVLTKWLEKESNRHQLIEETSIILNKILEDIKDEDIAAFISKKGTELIKKVEMNKVFATILQYLLDRQEHEKVLSSLLKRIKYYIVENEDTVRQRVKKESGLFVPGFVDNMLANRITVGLANFLHEIEDDKNHRIRQEITLHLYNFTRQLKEENKWNDDFEKIKSGLFSPENLQQYANDIWQNIKATVLKELDNKDSNFFSYLNKTISGFAKNLNTDETLRHKINKQVKYNTYRLILKNKATVAAIISNTVGNWKGRELSEKLELEVGKDLQYIRINGTLVGGLVGLLIYAITQLF